MRLPGLRVAALAALSLLISGCDLLYSYLDPFGLPPGGFGPPISANQFFNGRATLEITQDGQTQILVLDGINAYSYLDASYGAGVTWQNDDGWSVTVDAYDSSLGIGVPVGGWAGDVTINRTAGRDLWTTGSYTGWSLEECLVFVSELTNTKLTGWVECTKLRWVDSMNMSFDASAYVEGEEPFDARIDFEVNASTDPPGQSS